MTTTIRLAIAFGLIAAVLAGCSAPPSGKTAPGQLPRAEKVETTPDAVSTAATVDGYKADVAQRISQVNSTKVYSERPQALLRSVIVVRYAVDAGGNLVKSEIMRSNRDRANEATAMASLKNAAPFPKPAPHLLRHGRIELSESWLFNNDGRFQLRSVALPQAGE